MATAVPQEEGPATAAARCPWVQAFVLLVASAACYANSLSVPFLFDDPLPETRLEFRYRSLVWGSFALNRMVSGAAPWSYHVFNVLVHLGCGLLLLGVLRRAIASVAPQLAARTRAGLAFTATLLWLCHPLQTESVTYLSQRAEALGALWYLATLYAFLRYRSAPDGRVWAGLCFASLALGFATKETIATAPVVLLLADLVLLDGRPRENWRRRRAFFGGMALVSLALFGAFILPVLFASKTSSGFDLQASIRPLEYARSQPGIVLHYLRLAFWPRPLVFDYAWPVARGAAAIVPSALVILALLLLALALLARRSWIGFALAWFFVLLAPTSSIVPIADLAFEHRTYLPLASPVLLAVVGAWWACSRWLPGLPRLRPALALSAALALAVVTVRRNQEYASATRLWQTVVERAPHNARALVNLGDCLLKEERYADARTVLEEALRLDPDNDAPYATLGACYLAEERFGEARAALENALRLNPRSYWAYNNLGALCLRLHELDQAEQYLQQALSLTDQGFLHTTLGHILFAKGEFDQAETHLRLALGRNEQDAQAHLWLANTLQVSKQPAEAERHFLRCLQLDPGLQDAHINLAALLAAQGRHTEALLHDERALAIQPNMALEFVNLGSQLAALGRHAKALDAYRQALALDPDFAEAHIGFARTVVAKADASPAERSDAVHQAEQANVLAGGRRADVLETLAKACAATGDFDRARMVLREALALPGPSKNPILGARLRELLGEYEAQGEN